MVKKIIRAHKKEFKMDKCGFDHDQVDTMVRSQWQTRSKSNIYLAYRIAVAIFTTYVVIDSIINHTSKYELGKFFIYLTHWGILINMITGIMGAVLVTIWHFHSDYAGELLFLFSSFRSIILIRIFMSHLNVKSTQVEIKFCITSLLLFFVRFIETDKVMRNSEMPTVFKVYWAFHNTALITAFCITIIYWSILHKGNSTFQI